MGINFEKINHKSFSSEGNEFGRILLYEGKPIIQIFKDGAITVLDKNDVQLLGFQSFFDSIDSCRSLMEFEKMTNEIKKTQIKYDFEKEWRDGEMIAKNLTKDDCELLDDILHTCNFVDNRPEDFDWNDCIDTVYDMYEKGIFDIEVPDKYENYKDYIAHIFFVQEGFEPVDDLFYAIEDIANEMQRDKFKMYCDDLNADFEYNDLDR